MLVAQSCPIFATPWTAARQAPLSMWFSRQEYRSRLPFPSPGDLPNPGMEPRSPALQADSLPSELQGRSNSFLWDLQMCQSEQEIQGHWSSAPHQWSQTHMLMGAGSVVNTGRPGWAAGNQHTQPGQGGPVGSTHTHCLRRMQSWYFQTFRAFLCEITQLTNIGSNISENILHKLNTPVGAV